MAQQTTSSAELVTFYKALADANRLKIVGALAHKPYSVEELAALLSVRPSTISHHLAKLAQAGLVSARAQGYYSVYQLEAKSLERQARRLLKREDFTVAIQNMDLDAYDRKVVAAFSRPDGSMKTLPAQRKKLEAVLRHVVTAFEPGRRYTEQQVNRILARFHEDTASLRRELVGSGLMNRQGGGGRYWRADAGNPQH
jgi:predicted transcriptional regulator